MADRGNFGTTRCPVGVKKIYTRYVWKLDLLTFSVSKLMGLELSGAVEFIAFESHRSVKP